MSRMYNMGVQIKGFDASKRELIEEAATEEWHTFGDDWWFDEHSNTLSSYGDSTLCGGEEESEFAARLSKAIWKANGAYCDVEVTATYLEDLPYETFISNEDEYATYKKTGGL